VEALIPVHLRLLLGSHVILQHLLFSVELQSAKELKSNRRILGARPTREGFDMWLRYSAGTGLGLYGEARDRFLKQFRRQDLEKDYFKYCYYLFGQEHIHRRGNEKEMLLDALKKLPGLMRVQYSVVKVTGQDTVPLMSFLSPTAQEMLTQPDSFHGYRESNGHFWTLLQSACL
jgi:hypothetical protein